MQRISLLLVGVAALAGVVASSVPISGRANDEAAPIFEIKIPPPDIGTGSAYPWPTKKAPSMTCAPFSAMMQRSRPIVPETCRFLTAQSLSDWRGTTSRRKKTTKSLAVSSLSLPGLPRTFSSWSRTQKNTPRRAAGDSLNLRTASLTGRQTSKPASLVTSPSRLATLSSPVTPLMLTTSRKE